MAGQAPPTVAQSSADGATPAGIGKLWAMPLTNEKIAEIQTILQLLGKRVAADEITTHYEENLLALTDPEAFEKLLQDRYMETGPVALIDGKHHDSTGPF